MASAQVRPPAQPAALLPKLTVVWRLAPGDHDYNVALAKGDKAEAAQIKREAVVSKPVRMRQPPRLFARGCIDLTRCKQRAGKTVSAASLKTMSMDELTEALKSAEGKDKILIQKRIDVLAKEAGGAEAAIASLQKLLDGEKVGDAIKEMNAMNKELEKQTKSKKTDEGPLKKQVEQCQKILDAVVVYQNNL